MKDTIVTIGGILLALIIVSAIFLTTFENAADSAADHADTQISDVLEIDVDAN